MWEVEPTLYWRVKRDGEWRYERTRFVQVQPGLFAIEFPKPPEELGSTVSEVNESE